MADPPVSDDNECDLPTDNSVSISGSEGTCEATSTCNHSEANHNLGRNSPVPNHSNTSSRFPGATFGSDGKRKEANPYSFKHFLTGGNQNTGARPRHFTNNRSNSEPAEKNDPMNPISNSSSCSRSNRNLILNNPDLASGLPDFVQDHLIMEQCFLEPNSSDSPNTSYNLEDNHIYQLENAILNSSINCNEQNCVGENRSAIANDIPFDLTSTMPNERQDQDSLPSLPLDLPSFRSTNQRSSRPRDPPLDLPSSSNTGSGACSVNNSEVGTSKSLPDFLSDGPIHQRRDDELTENNDAAILYTPHELPPVERRLSFSQLQAENVRLRREVESLSSLLKESNDRLESTERRHRTFADNLDKELNSTKDDLRRVMGRAVLAEATIFELKQEIKALKAPSYNLLEKDQNGTNCDIEGVVGRTTSSPPSQDLNQRLASEIQNTATIAETSLRQLLGNVETLRIIAASLENSVKKSEIKESSPKGSNSDGSHNS